jgi:uncharacterized protein (AIM24 family)
MAEFSIREVEGMRQVCVDLADETIRTRRGALSNMRGTITVKAPLPGLRDLFRSFFVDEARIRPAYSGTGTLNLQASPGGFHEIDLSSERWILEPGVYLASEGEIDLGLFRERMFASFWAGDGFLVFKTVVSGTGRVIINTPGPVEVVDITDSSLRVQGRLVLGYTSGLTFSSRLISGYFRSFLIGQKRLRVLTGTGKALVCWTPYWNQHLYESVTGQHIEGSLFE